MLSFLNRWEESVPMFDQLIKLQPHDPETYYLRGAAILHVTGKEKQAIQDFETFLSSAHPHERKIPNGKAKQQSSSNEKRITLLLRYNLVQKILNLATNTINWD